MNTLSPGGYRCLQCKEELSKRENILCSTDFSNLLFALSFSTLSFLAPFHWHLHIRISWLLKKRITFLEKALPSAPETIYYAAGFGGNYIVVDQEHDLVVAVRWVGNTKTLDEIMKSVLASLGE